MDGEEGQGQIASPAGLGHGEVDERIDIAGGKGTVEGIEERGGSAQRVERRCG
jgi:hypothetical protein